MVDEARVARLLERVWRNLEYLHDRAAMDRTVIRTDPDRLASGFATAVSGWMSAPRDG